MERDQFARSAHSLLEDHPSLLEAVVRGFRQGSEGTNRPAHGRPYAVFRDLITGKPEVGGLRQRGGSRRVPDAMGRRQEDSQARRQGRPRGARGKGAATPSIELVALLDVRGG